MGINANNTRALGRLFFCGSTYLNQQLNYFFISCSIYEVKYFPIHIEMDEAHSGLFHPWANQGEMKNLVSP